MVSFCKSVINVVKGGGFGGFGFDGGFQMSFGIGAFPFGFFTSSFNFGDPRPGARELNLPLFLLFVVLVVKFC